MYQTTGTTKIANNNRCLLSPSLWPRMTGWTTPLCRRKTSDLWRKSYLFRLPVKTIPPPKLWNRRNWTAPGSTRFGYSDWNHQTLQRLLQERMHMSYLEGTVPFKRQKSVCRMSFWDGNAAQKRLNLHVLRLQGCASKALRKSVAPSPPHAKLEKHIQCPIKRKQSLSEIWNIVPTQQSFISPLAPVQEPWLPGLPLDALNRAELYPII